MTTTTRIPQTLDELYEILKAAPREKNTGVEMAYGIAHGLPVAGGEIDWASLPTFGGEEPADTTGIWSWDETRILVGTCPDDLEIIAREEHWTAQAGV